METDTHVPTPSNIQGYFSDAAVFVTGGTGFLGRLLVEKLLRTCSPRRIYILVRSKKGKTPRQRFQEYFDGPLYDLLKRKQSQDLEKLQMVEGDMVLPNLGMKEEDLAEVLAEVKAIFHVAATVRFDEKLDVAAKINVTGTVEVLKLAKRMKHLKSIVHVSTAYSFCPLKEIDEVFYKPTMSGESLLGVINSVDDDLLEKITPTIIGEWPNTYSFTKSVAEDVVRKEGADLPIAIVRPSIVVSTAKEPIAGWSDNVYGATGVCIVVGVGLLRTMLCGGNCISDLVPADHVVNCILAAAWDTANERSTNDPQTLQEDKKSSIPIYNYVSGPQKPLTWRKCLELGMEKYTPYSSIHQVWEPMFFPTTNVHLFTVLHLLLHTIPAYIVDFFLKCLGKKPQMVKTYTKISKGLDLLAYFSSQQWLFRNSNTQELWRRLDRKDKILFEFNMATLDWRSYFDTFTKGIRVYILKDPMDTIPQARRKRKMIKFAHYTLTGLLYGILLLFVLKVVL